MQHGWVFISKKWVIVKVRDRDYVSVGESRDSCSLVKGFTLTPPSSPFEASDVELLVQNYKRKFPSFTCQLHFKTSFVSCVIKLLLFFFSTCVYLLYLPHLLRVRFNYENSLKWNFNVI